MLFFLAMPSGLGFSGRMENNNTTKIDNRQYSLTEIAVGQLTAADLMSRGWEPKMWIAKGVRGAQFMVYQSKATGQFVRV
jgi:hypothetical protein